MLSDPISIYFMTEFILPPLKRLRVTHEQIRRLYNKMFEPGGYRYANLDLQSERPTLSTRREEGESSVSFGKESITIEEIRPEFAVDEFIGIVRTVLRGLGNDFPSFVLLQRCRIRCLAQPNQMDSIDLLAGRVANVLKAFSPFERPPSYFGVRFRFLPRRMLGGDDEDAIESKEIGDDEDAIESKEITESEIDDLEDSSNPDRSEQESSDLDEEEMLSDDSNFSHDEGFATVRFETYTEDHKKIWMEVATGFRKLKAPGVFTVHDINELCANITETYQLIAERSKRFLDQFDKPDPLEGDES